MDDEGKIDSFDDLFEPFELDESAPATQPQEAATRTQSAPTPMSQVNAVACPSCGTQNPTTNRHCESCGARIAQAPLPVAPQPMVRTTPGARALGVLAGVLLVVALLALIVNFLRGDGGDETATTGDTTTESTAANGDDGTGATSTTGIIIDVVALTPTRAEASTELPAFPVEALIDEDPTNSWNDEGLRGVGAELQFFFAQPVQITQIVMQNLTEEERFHRNYRIEGVEITIDDLPTAKIEALGDTMEPQTVEIASVRTTVVTMTVTSTYPAESFNDKPPFDELALQEVKFFGRPSPTG